MKVVIIGSGNVATVLGKKIQLAGHEIVQVVGRNEAKVRNLAAELNCDYTFKCLDVNKLADIVIICVADSAIASVSGQLQLKSQLVVHTAAGVSKDVLSGTGTNYGVMYPLQSLVKETSVLPAIPILVDGVDESTKAKLADFAADWADSVAFAGDEERVKLHLAAVFANNFVNHIAVLCQGYCGDKNLNYKLLGPLIEETMLRVRDFQALTFQTGPAVRRDFGTMRKHELLLHGNNNMLEVYKVLSNSIIAYHSTTSS